MPLRRDTKCRGTDQMPIHGGIDPAGAMARCSLQFLRASATPVPGESKDV
jgi:hypothetical protein